MHRSSDRPVRRTPPVLLEVDSDLGPAFLAAHGLRGTRLRGAGAED